MCSLTCVALPVEGAMMIRVLRDNRIYSIIRYFTATLFERGYYDFI